MGEVAEALTDGTSWQQAGNTSQRANVNGYDTTVSRTNVGSLVQRWSVAGTGQTSATVVAERMYTGATDGTLRKVDAHNGRTLWWMQFGDPVYYAPAVGYGRIFVTAGNTLYVIDAESGAHVYQVQHASPVGFSAPLFADGKVIVRDAEGTLWAYNPKATSTPSPVFTIEAQASADPSYGNGRVYVPTSNGTVAAYTVTGCSGTCARAWESAPLGGTSYYPAALWPPRLLLTVYGDDGSITERALDATTGASLWSTSLTGATDATGPAVGHGNVYVGLLGANEAWAIALTDGSLRWKASLAAEPSDAPAVANQIVYVPSGSTTGHLEAFGTSCATGGGTCTRLVDLPTAPYALAPSIAAGRIYVSGTSSTVQFGL